LIKSVRFSRAAERDLETIGDWIANENPNRAVTFIQELTVSCLQLGEMPERFALVSGYSNIRKRVHGNYVVYYRVTAEFIDILHILHGARDIDETELEAPNTSAA
jgi:toxin ParE1/3/4